MVGLLTFPEFRKILAVIHSFLFPWNLSRTRKSAYFIDELISSKPCQNSAVLTGFSGLKILLRLQEISGNHMRYWVSHGNPSKLIHCPGLRIENNLIILREAIVVRWKDAHSKTPGGERSSLITDQIFGYFLSWNQADFLQNPPQALPLSRKNRVKSAKRLPDSSKSQNFSHKIAEKCAWSTRFCACNQADQSVEVLALM